MDDPRTTQWLSQERYRISSKNKYNFYYLLLPGAESVRDPISCLEDAYRKRNLDAIAYFEKRSPVQVDPHRVVDLLLTEPEGRTTSEQVEFLLSRIRLAYGGIKGLYSHDYTRLGFIIGTSGERKYLLRIINRLPEDVVAYSYLDGYCQVAHDNFLEEVKSPEIIKYLGEKYRVYGCSSTAKVYHPDQEKLLFLPSSSRLSFFRDVYSNKALYDLIEKEYKWNSFEVREVLEKKPGFAKYVLKRQPNFSPYLRNKDYTMNPRSYRNMYISIIVNGIWEKFLPLNNPYVTPYRVGKKAIRTLWRKGDYRRLIELSSRLNILGISYYDYYNIVSARNETTLVERMKNSLERR